MFFNMDQGFRVREFVGKPVKIKISFLQPMETTLPAAKSFTAQSQNIKLNVIYVVDVDA